MKNEMFNFLESFCAKKKLNLEFFKYNKYKYVKSMYKYKGSAKPFHFVFFLKYIIYGKR